MWIVKIEKGTWLAPWDGDPGRTLVESSAKKFKTELTAQKALGRARALPHRNSFPYAKIESLTQ